MIIETYDCMYGPYHETQYIIKSILTKEYVKNTFSEEMLKDFRFDVSIIFTQNFVHCLEAALNRGLNIQNIEKSIDVLLEERSYVHGCTGKQEYRVEQDWQMFYEFVKYNTSSYVLVLLYIAPIKEE